MHIIILFPCFNALVNIFNNMYFTSYVDFSSKDKLVSVSKRFFTLCFTVLADESETVHCKAQDTNSIFIIKNIVYFQNF